MIKNIIAYNQFKRNNGLVLPNIFQFTLLVNIIHILIGIALWKFTSWWIAPIVAVAFVIWYYVYTAILNSRAGAVYLDGGTRAVMEYEMNNKIPLSWYWGLWSIVYITLFYRGENDR